MHWLEEEVQNTASSRRTVLVVVLVVLAAAAVAVEVPMAVPVAEAEAAAAEVAAGGAGGAVLLQTLVLPKRAWGRGLALRCSI